MQLIQLVVNRARARQMIVRRDPNPRTPIYCSGSGDPQSWALSDAQTNRFAVDMVGLKIQLVCVSSEFAAGGLQCGLLLMVSTVDSYGGNTHTPKPASLNRFN